jgi:ABC-type polysaccharide/polyol phosphate export permease
MTLAVDAEAPAFTDELRDGVSLGWLMALHDTRQRYRGSVLGPLWLTANLAATGFGVAFIYAALFHQPYKEYLAYLMSGLVAWSFIFATLSEASTTFIAAAGMIRNVRMPMLAHVFRVMFRQAIILLHNLAVLLIVLLLTGQFHLQGVIPALLGMILIALACLPAISILAMLGARFRDVPQIVTNLLQFVMFLTPIFWPADQATGRGFFIRLNPFYHLIALFRQPLLGRVVTLENYAVVIGLGVFGLIVAAIAWRWRRDRIVFWI